MKKFLAIALLIVLVASVFVVASTAAETPTYWAISSNCLIKSKVLDDGTVPTFKAVDSSDDADGLLVGLPTNATYGDAFFQAKDGYTLKYLNKDGNEITSSTAHIGTTDKVVVYKDGVIAAEYGLVTYGDADGDGVFDVIDAAIAALCQTGKMDATDNPAVYESVKPRAGFDNTYVEAEDYSQIVNDALKGNENLEENLKGRKTPIDDTLNFESVIYANTGAEKAATVIANDSRVKYSIKYNDGDTVPKESGIYSVTAEVADSEKYLVTPGTRELGFIVIAPKGSSETISSSDKTPAYTTIVDNANKTITIDITKPNATGADLTGYINGWLNSAYKLSVNSKAASSSAELGTALALTKYNYYKTASNIVSITEKSITDTAVTTNAALGCYLPDDYTLWNNNAATKTVPVTVSDGDQTFNYTISFKQNGKKIAALEETLLLSGSRAAGARGQRSSDPVANASLTNNLFVECKRRYTAETSAYENVTRIAVYVPASYISFLEKTMAGSMSGTGFKTILLGDADTIGFLSANKKSSFPAVTKDSMHILYDTTEGNLRFSGYDTALALKKQAVIMDLVDKVLGGMNLGITVDESTKPSELVNKTGWCRYLCADDVTGLRYTTDYHLEFMKVDASQDTHRTLSVTAVDGCKISISNPTTNLDRMTYAEPFRVTATLPEGYKLSVKDASGKDVYYEAEHDWYIMPNSNVTVTAVKA